MGLKLGVPEVVPFRIPLPGIIGTVVNGVVQGAVAGGIVFVGYLISGQVVNFVDNAIGQGKLLGAWQRPVLFAAVAGVIGSGVAFLAPRGKKLQWSLLAAAGPGVRAFSGIVANLIPAGSTGIMADVKAAAQSLGDYLQVGDLYEAGLGYSAYDGMDDYLQVGDMYEAGLGAEEDEEVFV